MSDTATVVSEDPNSKDRPVGIKFQSSTGTQIGVWDRQCNYSHTNSDNEKPISNVTNLAIEMYNIDSDLTVFGNMNTYSTNAYYGFSGDCKTNLYITNTDTEVIYLGIQGQSLNSYTATLYANMGKMGLYFKKKAAFLSFGTATEVPVDVTAGQSSIQISPEALIDPSSFGTVTWSVEETSYTGTSSLTD